MGLTKRGYYTLRDILGYSAKYNIVLSDRGRGKSWDAKWFLIGQPGKFMCIYRQSSDMTAAMNDWTDPLTMGDEDHKALSIEQFEWEGNDKEGYQLLFNGSVKGYFRYITQVNHIKQEVFPDDLNWVWLDEFIPLVYKKLPGVQSEGDAIRTIVKTIEHDTVHTREEKGLKPVRVIMYANPFNWNNPILSYFKINGLLGPGIHRAGPGVVWEMLEPYEEVKKNNKMTVDEFLGNEVNRNMGFMDQGAFVEKIPKGAEPYMSIRIDRMYWTVYQKGRRWYLRRTDCHRDVMVSYGMGHKVLMKYGSTNGLMEDEINLDISNMGKTLTVKAYNGALRYEDINCKFDFLNAIGTLRR